MQQILLLIAIYASVAESQYYVRKDLLPMFGQKNINKNILRGGVDMASANSEAADSEHEKEARDGKEDKHDKEATDEKPIERMRKIIKNFKASKEMNLNTGENGDSIKVSIYNLKRPRSDFNFPYREKDLIKNINLKKTLKRASKHASSRSHNNLDLKDIQKAQSKARVLLKARSKENKINLIKDFSITDDRISRYHMDPVLNILREPSTFRRVNNLIGLQILRNMMKASVNKKGTISKLLGALDNLWRINVTLSASVENGNDKEVRELPIAEEPKISKDKHGRQHGHKKKKHRSKHLHRKEIRKIEKEFDVTLDKWYDELKTLRSKGDIKDFVSMVQYLRRYDNRENADSSLKDTKGFLDRIGPLPSKRLYQLLRQKITKPKRFKPQKRSRIKIVVI